VAPRSCVASKPLRWPYASEPNRRESERFPIMRCNRLRPSLLCILYPRSSGESSGGLTIRCQSQQKFTRLHHPVNSLAHHCLQRFLGDALALGIGLAFSIGTNRNPYENKRNSHKQTRNPFCSLLRRRNACIQPQCQCRRHSGVL